MLNIGNLMIDGLDYVMIVDTGFHIIYNSRYDEYINSFDGGKGGRNPGRAVMPVNFFEAYPGLSRKDSSVYRCMQTQQVIINKRQTYSDYQGKRYITNNVTLPLRRRNELIAVVELVMDIRTGCEEADIGAEDKKFDDFVFRLKTDAGLITFDSIRTVNRQMKENIEKARILLRLPSPTLIYGETGTGKELFAQAMITQSGIPREKVIVQNCAAVPENLMESILFGTVKGVYTGAENKKGLFEEADGGILFLDELNSMPYHVQAKLLRVLQDGTFRPLGAEKDRHTNIKIIAAMNTEPTEAIENNTLRADLFYRFSNGLIRIPPLRERIEDIDLYLSYYADHFNRLYNKNIQGFSAELRRTLRRYSWEGNVRELKNTVESMVIAAKEREMLQEQHLPKYLFKKIAGQSRRKEAEKLLKDCGGADLNEEQIPYHEIMETVERRIIEEALRRTGGNKTGAGRILGIPRKTLEYRISKLGIGD